MQPNIFCCKTLLFGMRLQWSRNMPDLSGRLLLMSGRELIPCWTFCPACCNTHKMSDNKGKDHHWYWPVINWEKCLTWAQNVRQSAEGLPDILSGMLEIIFAITDERLYKITPKNSDKAHLILFSRQTTLFGLRCMTSPFLNNLFVLQVLRCSTGIKKYRVIGSFHFRRSK